MQNLNQKNFDTILTEANDYFNATGLSILGEGYKEIASNPALFESYVDMLTEGANPNSAAQMAQLMENSNKEILTEGSIAGIQPMSSLAMPVIRKLWPKFVLKDALDTEVAKVPRFSITYTRPYMYKGDGEKIYLPRGLNSVDGFGVSGRDKALRKPFTQEHTVTLANGAATVVDFEFLNGVSGTQDSAVVIADTPSAAKKQTLDELVFVSVNIKVKDAVEESGTSGQPGYVAAADAVYNTVNLGKRLDVLGNGLFELGNGQLIVKFDGKNRKATFAYVGGAAATGLAAAEVKVTVKAGVSTEYNEDSFSVGFEVQRQDVDIPTGQHINADLPVEFIKDMMALYQIDGTKETVDIMTNTFAYKLDLEILDFIQNSMTNRPSNEAYPVSDNYGTLGDFLWEFDCKPAAGFAGSPKAWREEIKPLIDFLAQKIKNETYLQSGVFTIVCNPIDAQILANVDWSFRGGQGGNMDGVDVDYSVGTYVGANAYKVIASVNVPQGVMYVIFTPSAKTQMTYKYYPYTFSTEVGYTDPNRSRVPSIMMTARRTMYEFMPAIGAIVIKNNDGRGYFSKYVSTRNVTSSSTYLDQDGELIYGA